MDALASFTYDTFRDRTGETFAVPASGVELMLAAARSVELSPREGGGFSLLFTGPGEPALPQATHELTHRELGAFGLFLVPVARTAEGMEYEAVFN